MKFLKKELICLYFESFLHFKLLYNPGAGAVAHRHRAGVRRLSRRPPPEKIPAAPLLYVICLWNRAQVSRRKWNFLITQQGETSANFFKNCDAHSFYMHIIRVFWKCQFFTLFLRSNKKSLNILNFCWIFISALRSY